MTQPAEARAARPEDAEAVLQTLCAAFGLDPDAARPLFFADPYYELSHKRVLTLPANGIVSCLTIVPTVIRIGGAAVPAGGIAGVSTWPALQHQGHAAALLKATVPALWNELGYPLSLLHPISAPFYRRLGWETASHVLEWSGSPTTLPRYAADCVRPAHPSDWPAITLIHADQTQDDTGSCVRDTRRWQLIQMPVPERETHVSVKAGEVSGYLIGERGKTFNLLEMHGQTETARHGLVGFLARQAEPTITWQTSPALVRRFGLSSAKMTLKPDVMLRIVDLKASLVAVHAVHYAPVLAEAGASLTLQVTDPLRSQNERPLRLTQAGIATGAADRVPWLRTDIQTLARLYFGDCAPSQAHADGALAVDSPITLPLADRLFPLRCPYIAPLDQS